MLKFFKLEVDHTSFFFVEIASGNEKGFLESDGLGDLTKDASSPGFGSAVIKSTEDLSLDLSLVPDVFMGLEENSTASENTRVTEDTCHSNRVRRGW